jgi:hypothetical protein
VTAPAAEAPGSATSWAIAWAPAIGWWRLGLIMLGALALAAGIAVVDARPVGVFYDDAMYVVLARSLATGQGYRFLNLPGAPAAGHFPPGYPALLAIVSLVAPAFPASLVVFKALNAFFLAATAVLATRFARAHLLGAPWALGLGVATAVSVPLLLLGSMVLSEMFFLALLLALLPAVESLVERPATTWRVVLVGVAMGACTLVRSHGIVLVLAAVLLLAFRGRGRDAVLVGAGAMLCLLPWQIWSAYSARLLPAPLLGSYGTYAGWWMRGFQEMGPALVPATLARTVPETLGMFAVLFSPMRSALAHVVTLAILAALAATGAAAARHRMPVTLCFVAGYLAVVAIWPFPPSRFVWGIWPLLLLLVVAGAHAAVRYVGARAREVRVAAMLAFAWIVLGYGAYELRGVRGAWWSTIARANTRRIAPAVGWAAQHTAPGDVLAAEDEVAIYLYTGRRAVPVSAATTVQYLRGRSVAESAADGLRPILSAYPVHTVIVGTRQTADVADFLVNAPTPRLALRAEFAGGVAYTVLPK